MTRGQYQALDEHDLIESTHARYVYLRDYGHTKYVKKARECDAFVTSEQWTEGEKERLRAARRPALTMNLVLSTVQYILGNQIRNRVDVTFLPREKTADNDLAVVIGKVYRAIADENKLDFLRSEVFADGVIGSRGFFDVRMAFDDNLRGSVAIKQIDPKTVLIDSDASSYDPEDWNDVITLSFATYDDLKMMYGAKMADKVRYSAGFDRDTDFVTAKPDSFGQDNLIDRAEYDRYTSKRRMYMLIEHQHRELDAYDHFINLTTGDITPVPQSFTPDEVEKYLTAHNGEVRVFKRTAKRVRWTVICNGVLLHDEWSPYPWFTVVPYFPFFRRGVAVGIVESLLDPQRALNKSVSQQVHILNTTANSGWMVKKGALTNMTLDELETRGAETGLVVEVNDMDGLEKILPNQTPTGLDRISYLSSEFIKQVSGVSDYQRGDAREDVSAKAVIANQQTGATNHVKALDNLRLTDLLLAKRVLHLMQTYYTEPRVVRVVTDPVRMQTEAVEVNAPIFGAFKNDLTVGEYDIVVASTPDRDAMEDNEFEQAIRLRTEANVQIPDAFIIAASRLRDKGDILKAIEAQSQSPAAQQQQAAMQAEIDSKKADAALKVAKAQESLQPKGNDNAAKLAELKQKYEMDMKRLALDAEIKTKELELKYQQMQNEQQMSMMQQQHERQMAEREASDKADAARVAAHQQNTKPKPKPKTKGSNA